MDAFLKNIDAVYIRSLPKLHYEHIKKALEAGKHVLCESPMTLNPNQSKELMKLAKNILSYFRTGYPLRSRKINHLTILIKVIKITFPVRSRNG